MTLPHDLTADASAAPRRRRLTAPDQREIALWHWPSQAGRPQLHWAHATGFHARTYAPLLEAMAKEVDVMAWDMRGHGDSRDAGVAATFRGWESYYRDLCALLDQAPTPIILAGHSVGATTSLFAAARRPDKVAGLLLVEPVILGRRERLQLALGKLFGKTHRLPLAAGAARRRAEFPDRQAAFDSYRGRGAFASWPDAWLWAYIKHGFIDTEAGVHLACEPAWESRSFAATEHRPLRAARGLRCPIIALAGQTGSTFPADSRASLKRLCPQAQISEIAGSSHFLPMERADEVLLGLQELLAKARL